MLFTLLYDFYDIIFQQMNSIFDSNRNKAKQHCITIITSTEYRKEGRSNQPPRWQRVETLLALRFF